MVLVLAGEPGEPGQLGGARRPVVAAQPVRRGLQRELVLGQGRLGLAELEPYVDIFVPVMDLFESSRYPGPGAYRELGEKWVLANAIIAELDNVINYFEMPVKVEDGRQDSPMV